mgnify:CR=1 FL=1
MAIVPVGLLPRDVGYITALGPLYVSLGFTAFSAFFAGFMDKEELPKKYKLFLMMLPFLVAVFLFSYLPLYGRGPKRGPAEMVNRPRFEGDASFR